MTFFTAVSVGGLIPPGGNFCFLCFSLLGVVVVFKIHVVVHHSFESLPCVFWHLHFFPRLVPFFLHESCTILVTPLMIRITDRPRASTGLDY